MNKTVIEAGIPEPAEHFSPCDGIYLLTHSVGRPPTSAQENLDEQFFAPWLAGNGDPWVHWLASIDRFRTALARLLNGTSDDFCPQTNLSSALSKIVSALPLRAGQASIVFSEDDFPSMGFVLQQAVRYGYRLKCVPRSANPFDLQVWDDALSDDVGLLLLTHVQSNTGRRLPIREILALSEARGIVAVVDVAQSVGIVPIDLQRWAADFVIGSSVKWLCGGPGAGWLWANPRIVGQCTPADVGWFSHAEPFAFAIHDFRYHPGALRFWGGTPSVLPFVLAGTSIALIAELGVERVHSHNQALTQRLIDAIDAMNPCILRSPRNPLQRGGTLIADFAEHTAAARTRLDACSVRYDVRAAGMRLSPHIYNGIADIDVVIDCLQQLS